MIVARTIDAVETIDPLLLVRVELRATSDERSERQYLLYASSQLVAPHLVGPPCREDFDAVGGDDALGFGRQSLRWRREDLLEMGNLVVVGLTVSGQNLDWDICVEVAGAIGGTEQVSIQLGGFNAEPKRDFPLGIVRHSVYIFVDEGWGGELLPSVVVLNQPQNAEVLVDEVPPITIHTRALATIQIALEATISEASRKGGGVHCIKNSGGVGSSDDTYR